MFKYNHVVIYLYMSAIFYGLKRNTYFCGGNLNPWKQTNSLYILVFLSIPSVYQNINQISTK